MSPVISSSYPGNMVQYNSTDETDSDAISTQSLTQSGQSNAFGHPKTTRYNRPVCSKKALDRRERIMMQHSNCIQQIKEEKDLLDKVLLFYVHMYIKYSSEIYDMNIRHKYSAEIYNRNIQTTNMNNDN